MFDGENEIQSLVGRRARQHPPDFGNATTFAQIVDNDELLGTSRKLLKAIKYTGVCEVEYKFDPEDHTYKFLEINPRTWKWHSIAAKAGSNMLENYYRFLHHQELQPISPLKKASFRHILTDVPTHLKYKLKGINKKHPRYPIQYAVWSKNDILPAIFELIYLPYLILKDEIIFLVGFLLASLFSTFWYLYLHKKTRINIKFVYIDNIIVIGLSMLLLAVEKYISPNYLWFISIPFIVLGLSFILTMIRFWRTPNRSIKAKAGEIVSPADGNIIYIKEIPSGTIPISIKNGLEASIEEISQTNLLNQGGWLIGINMTPFDVHKNCAPIGGKIVLNEHINGEFLSLKEPTALIQNERNTLVLETPSKEYFGIIQTASKLVRRIDSYVKTGQNIEQGDWFGMIRFGSQVDLILPKEYQVNVKLGEQTYAKSTIIARK